MNTIGALVKCIVAVGNILAGIGFLLAAYSPQVHPSAHPFWACLGLALPLFILLNACFLVFWLLLRSRYLLLPFLFFLAGAGSLTTYFAVGSPTPSEGTAYKLLTYNTQGKLFRTDKEHPADTSLLNYLKRCNADIICLQEFMPNSDKALRQVNKALSAYPYSRYTRFKNGNGVACYSRFPILSHHLIDYQSRANGSVLYRLKMDQDPVLLINNHLASNKINGTDKARYRHLLQGSHPEAKQDGKHLLGKLKKAVIIRAAQADSVAKVLRNTPTAYVLVCGDFNDSPVSYAHHTIGRGLTDAFTEAGFGTGITYYQSWLYFRIDHIFAGPAFRVLQCETDRSIRASDHFPLWCTFEKRFP